MQPIQTAVQLAYSQTVHWQRRHKISEKHSHEVG